MDPNLLIGIAAAVGSLIGSLIARWLMGLFKTNVVGGALICNACGGTTDFVSNDRAYVIEATKSHVYSHLNCKKKEETP